MTARGNRVPAGATADVPRKPLVAFQGERGAYGDEAIARRWRGEAFPVPSWSFDDVVRAVVTGKADYGVLPVENAIVGPIVQATDALRATPALEAIDEITIPIRHALLALPDTTLADLRTVASHPAALRQCRRLFERYPYLTPCPSYDTAGAAREVAAHGRREEAAIAGTAAAARYGLSVIADDVQDVPRNWTRFVVVARRVPVRLDGHGAWR